MALWNKGYISLEGLGVTSLYYVLQDQSWNEVKINTSQPEWRLVPNELGYCFSYTAPQKFQEKGLAIIQLGLENGTDFFVFLHSNGILNPWYPFKTIGRSQIRIKQVEPTYFEVDYLLRRVLDFDGKPCNDDENYDFTTCMQELTRKVQCTCL